MEIVIFMTAPIPHPGLISKANMPNMQKGQIFKNHPLHSHTWWKNLNALSIKPSTNIMKFITFFTSQNIFKSYILIKYCKI